MSLTAKALEALNGHWAVSAIAKGDRERAERIARERLVQAAVGEQIAFSFKQEPDDATLLERIALAYELAAIEGLDELHHTSKAGTPLRDQAVAASFQAFNVRRLLPVPRSAPDHLHHVLHLSALAYCGDRWSDLRRWYKEHEEALEVPSVADVRWDRRVLYRLFHCWIRLFRKKGWDDLDRIRETISGLREDQRRLERGSLQNGSQELDRSMALRLAALYHWAKGTEVLALYMLQGEPPNPFGVIDKHFEAGARAASSSGDAQHEIILRWLHAAARIMARNSLWWTTKAINPKTSSFVHSLTHRDHQPMFELLPPQSAALREQGLLDQAKTSIVVDIPTSGGKTLLAQFRILQALNQFAGDDGWVAYLAPTRALTAQITRRLRNDFEPINLRVEQLTAAVEIDAFEEKLLAGTEQPFHVLVATPEKLSLVIRNKKVRRPLALVVMDEAHNLETKDRGLRMELLLATVKRDCSQANFLLLMPYVEESESIARWLAHDIETGRAISLGTMPWKPNERIIGLYRAVGDPGRGNWHLEYETLTATKEAMPLQGTHEVGGMKPLDVPKSKVLGGGRQIGLGLQTSAIATVMSGRGTSVAVGDKIKTAWKMAKEAAKVLPEYSAVPDDIRFVQDFLRSEVSPDFLLVDTLEKGVGVHHAGLSDDARALMEWLAESGSLRILCATSTISQGINFPVSSVFLSTRKKYHKGKMVDMSPREFWNLAGRAGRIGHDSVGVVGMPEGADRAGQIDFLNRSTGTLVSQLVSLLDEFSKIESLDNLSESLWKDQWEDFRCYIAHLWSEKKNLDAVLMDAEQLLRNTYGYSSLRSDPAQKEKADALLHATEEYARKIAGMPSGVAELADSTGFSPEGVMRVMRGLRNLDPMLCSSDLMPESLFGHKGKFSDLFGIMLDVPQLKQQLQEIGGVGFDHSHIAAITRDWVNGMNIKDISVRHFNRDKDDERGTDALTDACKAIYRSVVNFGTWGMSAVSRISVGFESLSEAEKRKINALPAMIYHGVRTEDAVLMRMNSAPRSASEKLGNLYREACGADEDRYSINNARNFLRELDDNDWSRSRPPDAPLSGAGYRRAWGILAGEQA